MPRLKQLAAYPREYWDLFAVAYERGKVEITVNSHVKAEALRSQLYNFRTAMRNDGGHPDFIRKADALSFIIDGQTLVIKSQHYVSPAIKEVLSNETNIQSGNKQ